MNCFTFLINISVSIDNKREWFYDNENANVFRPCTETENVNIKTVKIISLR